MRSRATRFPEPWRCLCCLLLFVCLPLRAAGVTLVLSEPGGIYQEAAFALQTELEQAGIQVTQETRAQRGLAQKAPTQREDWIVVLGLAALRRVLDERATTPVLSVLVPRAGFQQAIAGKTRPVTALYLDQPLARMAALQRIALPDSRQSGVLFGPSLQSLRADADQAASAQRLELQARTIASSDEVFPALTELAGAVDMLWLLPDPLVVNRISLQSLFLQTYRQHRPVLAYSAGLVQAGAMLGLYATPAQFGREAAQWLRSLLAAGARRPPPARYPLSFTVAVNASVARSLNMSLPPVDELTRRLQAQSQP